MYSDDKHGTGLKTQPTVIAAGRSDVVYRPIGVDSISRLHMPRRLDVVARTACIETTRIVIVRNAHAMGSHHQDVGRA
jgi:hypothetical protein